MEREAPNTGKIGQVEAKVTKRYADLDESISSVETEPLYANETNILRVGHSVFVDFGIVPVDDIVSVREKRTVRVFVLQRVVMDTEAFSKHYRKCKEIHDILVQQGVVTDVEAEAGSQGA